MTPAQDPDQELGGPAPDTRWQAGARKSTGGENGCASVPLISPPRDTELAKTAPVVSTYTFTKPNVAPAETWSSGHRTPYGLAFSPDGRLWEVEHGLRGGDELNLIEPGKNYGWPPVLRRQLQWHANPESRHTSRTGEAGDLLDPRHRARQPHLLQRCNVPAVEGIGADRRM